MTTLLKRTLCFFGIIILAILPFTKLFSCTCISFSDTFCESITEEHQLVLAEMVSFDGGSNAYYRVLEGINNNLDGDTILVLGHDGANCLEEIIYGTLTDTILLALGGVNASTYALDGCGIYYAFYNRDTLSLSGIFSEKEKMAYTDFLANLADCQQLSEYRPGSGRIVDWRDTTVGLSQFDFKMNNLALKTDEQGRYYFPNIPLRGEYLEPDPGTPISPVATANPLQSVTTADLISLQKHILGISPFDHPEQYLAADVDHSQHVSVMDVLLLRRIILHIDTEFPRGQSWRFIPLDYEFPNPANPWSEEIPDAIWINYRFDVDNELVYRQEGLDFRAIKLGAL